MRTRLVLTALLALLTATAARAEKGDGDARSHFEEGTKAFNLGEFDRAAKEYRAAYVSTPNPIFLYNIGQSYRLANNLPQAVFFYRSYLRNDPTAKNRREVEDRIRKLEAQIRAQQALTDQPPNVPVAPGGLTSDGASEPVPEVPSEPSEVKPSAASTPPSTASHPPEAVVSTSAPEKSDQPIYKKWWLWTAVGAVVVVGVGLGVGLGLGLSGSSTPSTHFGNTGVF